MNFGKLIINTAILGPIGYGMGYGFGWLLHASPILFGAGVAVAFVALSMRPGSNAPSTERRGGDDLFTEDTSARGSMELNPWNRNGDHFDLRD